MSDWTKEVLRLCQTEFGKSIMDVTAQRTSPCDACPALRRIKLGGRGVVKVETEN